MPYVITKKFQVGQMFLKNNDDAKPVPTRKWVRKKADATEFASIADAGDYIHFQGIRDARVVRYRRPALPLEKRITDPQKRPITMSRYRVPKSPGDRRCAYLYWKIKHDGTGPDGNTEHRFSGGPFGDHTVTTPSNCFTRARAHWEGYKANARGDGEHPRDWGGQDKAPPADLWTIAIRQTYRDGKQMKLYLKESDHIFTTTAADARTFASRAAARKFAGKVGIERSIIEPRRQTA